MFDMNICIQDPIEPRMTGFRACRNGRNGSQDKGFRLFKNGVSSVANSVSGSVSSRFDLDRIHRVLEMNTTWFVIFL